MITLVIVTLLLLRGAQMNADEFPYGHSKWTFASYLVAKALGSGAYNPAWPPPSCCCRSPWCWPS